MADKPPADDKELTQEQRDKVARWVTEKWGPNGNPCPICKHTTWFVGQHLVSPLTISPGGGISLSGGPTYPFAQLCCQNCGNTQFLNAVMFGLVKSSETKAEPEEPQVKKEGSSG